MFCKTNISIFAQILQEISRNDLNKIVIETGAERYAKGYSARDHLAAMMFGQLGKANSLREIEGGLASCCGKLNHLGLKGAPAKSTLAYANKTRPVAMFEKLFYCLLDKCSAMAGSTRRKFRFKNPLYSLDASVIDLSLSMFDWAKFRTTKGAVKIHMVLDHDGYLPTFLNITEGNVHEINVARMLDFEPGAIIAMDKGYTDYGLFAEWTRKKVYFVTRQKENARYSVVKEMAVPETSDILKDQLIELDGFYSIKSCPYLLRRIEVWNDEKNEIMVFLTNHTKLSPATIAAIYKERWQIEIFFKTIKQNLKIKTFIGTSKNAVLTQIWTAFIAILMLKYLKLKSSFNWSLSNLVTMLRFNLLVYRPLGEWLNNPYQPPPEPEHEQLKLAF